MLTLFGGTPNPSGRRRPHRLFIGVLEPADPLFEPAENGRGPVLPSDRLHLLADTGVLRVDLLGVIRNDAITQPLNEAVPIEHAVVPRRLDRARERRYPPPEAQQRAVRRDRQEL